MTGAVCLAATAVYALIAFDVIPPWAHLGAGMTSAAETEPVVLLRWGAKSASLVSETGEWWRLFTFHFTHTSLLHLVFNLAFLFPVGGALEQVLLRRDYAVLLWLSAAISGACSLIFTPELSAGASGLVFAVLAAAVVVGLRHGAALRAGVREHFGVWVLPFLMIVLGIGIGNPYVDHSSHLGGLIAGALLGPFLRLRNTVPLATHEPWRIGAWVSLALVCVWVAPWLARGGQPALRIERREGVSLVVPSGWQTDYGPLGEYTLHGAGGWVTVTVETIPTNDDPLAWYFRYRLAPLLGSGVLDGYDRPTAAQTMPPDPHHPVRLRLSRNGLPLVRDVVVVRSTTAPELYLVAFETPLEWLDKYAETRAMTLGSVTSAATPGAFSSRPMVQAAAIP